jgi:hypothetical protein
VNKLLEQAVRQSLDLQREWLGQWSERAGDRKLKPKIFAELRVCENTPGSLPPSQVPGL